MLCKMVLLQDEKLFLIEVYFATKSLKNSREMFATKFNKAQLSKTSITHLVQRFWMHGSVAWAPYERGKPVLTLAKLVKIGEVFAATPLSSLRQCSHSYGFVRTSTDFCTDFFKNTYFWTFVRIFFFKRPFL